MRRRSSTETTSSCSQAPWRPIRSSVGCRRETRSPSSDSPFRRREGASSPCRSRHGTPRSARAPSTGSSRATPCSCTDTSSGGSMERSRSSEPHGGGGHGDQEARAARRLRSCREAPSWRPVDGRLGLGPWADADRGEAGSSGDESFDELLAAWSKAESEGFDGGDAAGRSPALWRGETVTDDALGLDAASLGPLGIEAPPIVVGGTTERVSSPWPRHSGMAGTPHPRGRPVRAAQASPEGSRGFRGRSSGRCSFGSARSASKAHMMRSREYGDAGADVVRVRP